MRSRAIFEFGNHARLVDCVRDQPFLVWAKPRAQYAAKRQLSPAIAGG
jgi:hypothetical protein